MIWLIIFIIVFVLFLFFVIRSILKNKIDTITAFTGGLGSGKSFESVRLAIKLYKRNVRKVKINNFFAKIFKNRRVYEMPKFYSNIPIFISKKYGYSYRLTTEILLLQEKIPLKSVVLIDEIGAFANQMQYNLPNIVDNFNEFVRFFRHYTEGGYMVVNDQCSENINLWVRRRLNVINNMSKFYIIPFLRIVFYFKREICISEEIKQVLTDEDSLNDTTKLCVAWLPFYLSKKNKHYDTYCYSGRYQRLDNENTNRFKRLKTNIVLTCPRERVDKYTEERKENAK